MTSNLYLSRSGERIGTLVGSIAAAVTAAYQPGGVADQNPEGHFRAGDVPGPCEVFSITPDTGVWAD